MFSRGLLARFARDRYNSLAVVAIVVGLLVFGLIITTIILHLAFLWLVLVSATVMLFTAFGYSTCTDKEARMQSLQQPGSCSESISTISDNVETGSTEDFPPCYDVVIGEDYEVSPDSKPPSYVDALALQRSQPNTITNTPNFNNSSELEPHSNTSSQLGSFNSSSPPRYEDVNTCALARDHSSETTPSLSDTQSLGDTSDYTISSYPSYESLCLAYNIIVDNSEITLTHYNARSCSTQCQTNLHRGQVSDMSSIASIC